jgi:transcriptional regulator with XRE-family HTH domain
MWKFGQYISELLSAKDWNMAKLAKEAGLSHQYVRWVVNGETADKPNPPSISVDTLLSLSRALGASPIALLRVYDGKSPDSDEQLAPDTLGLLADFIGKLPPEVVIQALEQRFPDKDSKKRFAQKYFEGKEKE